jgi:Ca2+-binding EF-hand superfamily protein
MAIADVDESGTIDLGEFKEFIEKVSEDMDAEAIKEIFDSIDVN